MAMHDVPDSPDAYVESEEDDGQDWGAYMYQLPPHKRLRQMLPFGRRWWVTFSSQREAKFIHHRHSPKASL